MPPSASQPALPLVAQSPVRSAAPVVAELSSLPPQDLLRELLDCSLILPEQWASLAPAKRDMLQQAFDARGSNVNEREMKGATSHRSARERSLPFAGHSVPALEEALDQTGPASWTVNGMSLKEVVRRKV